MGVNLCDALGMGQRMEVGFEVRARAIGNRAVADAPQIGLGVAVDPAGPTRARRSGGRQCEVCGIAIRCRRSRDRGADGR